MKYIEWGLKQEEAVKRQEGKVWYHSTVTSKPDGSLPGSSQTVPFSRNVTLLGIF